MKKFNNTIKAIFLFTLLSFSFGCNKFLDINPLYTQDAENFFENNYFSDPDQRDYEVSYDRLGSTNFRNCKAGFII